MVLQIFRALDKPGRGEILIEELLKIFDPAGHPSVADGLISPTQAVKHFVQHFAQEGSDRGSAHWTEFLDYYKGISMAIDDDGVFEMLIRQMWYGVLP